jgi:hypothetical protein
MIEEMVDIDVDEIADINYLEGSTPEDTGGVEITFKNGTTKVYQGSDLMEVLTILNHWTPPTA